MSFLRLEALPETLEFKITGEKFHDSGLDTKKGENYILSHMFFELKSGVLLPYTIQNQSRLGLSDEEVLRFDNREVEINYDMNKTSMEFMLSNFQRGLSNNWLESFFERKYGFGLDIQRRTRNEVNCLTGTGGDYKTSFPLAVSPQDQLYLPEIPEKRKQDFSRGYINTLEEEMKKGMIMGK